MPRQAAVLVIRQEDSLAASLAGVREAMQAVVRRVEYPAALRVEHRVDQLVVPQEVWLAALQAAALQAAALQAAALQAAALQAAALRAAALRAAALRAEALQAAALRAAALRAAALQAAALQAAALQAAALQAEYRAGFRLTLASSWCELFRTRASSPSSASGR